LLGRFGNSCELVIGSHDDRYFCRLEAVVADSRVRVETESRVATSDSRSILLKYSIAEVGRIVGATEHLLIGTIRIP
jgi:hypothetical protein